MEKGTVGKLFDHFFSNHQDEVVLAMREFFEDETLDRGSNLELQDEREEGLFMEWIAFDYRLQNGKNVLEDFVAENPFNLSKDQLKVYEDLQMNKYGWYEVVKVKLDEYIDLESLQSGKVYRVKERAGTHDAEPKTTLICRVGKVGDHWELIGSDPLALPVYHTERRKTLMRQDKSRMTPKDARMLLIDRPEGSSEFEESITLTKSDLEKRRKKIKKELEDQLVRVKSSSSAEDILKIIYNESGNGSDWLMKILDMLTDQAEEPTQELVDLASSAWNHFPHKSLGGKSPAEKAKEVYGGSGGKTSKRKMDAEVASEKELPVGAFLPLGVIITDLADRETKTVVLPEEKYGLAPGAYRLVENYCADRFCDCRKVMVNVVDEKSKVLATIGFGWESVKFYEKWVQDKELAMQMTGAYLEEMGTQTEQSKNCLRLFKKVIKDPAYINRFRQHYKQFKDAI